MANKNNVRMPSSMAGITTYYEGEKSSIMLHPKQVMVLITGVCAVILLMHLLL